MHVLIAGCGWLGRGLASELLSRGHRVTGVRRSPEAERELREAGIEPRILDLASPATAAGLPRDVDAVIACQSATVSTAEAYRTAYVDATRTLLAAAERMPSPPRFVFTSSTGVFGQSDGGIVDETTAVAPAGATAEVLVEAERLVLDAASLGIPACVVRLSGLYGPGRTGVIERVRRGALALGPGDDTWTNWCHLDDAVATVLAALERGRAGAVYHASDPSPARRSEVVRWVAARLGIEPPRGSAGTQSAPGNRRGANRRIAADRTRAELDLTPLHPSFREGLSTGSDVTGVT
jgi:nucleoside-diphosphate-sugar epimerase